MAVCTCVCLRAFVCVCVCVCARARACMLVQGQPLLPAPYKNAIYIQSVIGSHTVSICPTRFHS